MSIPAEKKKKADTKKSSKSVKSDKSVKSSSSRLLATSSTDQGKSTTSSTDSRISDLDRKWSDRFNRLEALLMAKTLDRPQDPTFSTVKVAPKHTPPASVVRTDPFLKPVTQPSQITDRPAVDPPTTLIRTVCHQTDHSWIFSRKRANFLRIKRLTCLTMTNPSQRNNPTGRP